MKWNYCKEKLPAVYYDTLGNWSSNHVLLYFEDGHFDTGVFNPTGAFEGFDDDGFCVFVGSPYDGSTPDNHVIAWANINPPKKENER